MDHPLYWTLREIARLERGGLRSPRLTEPDQERWLRVQRKLGWIAFIELLHQDLAEAFPAAVALDRWSSHPTAGLDEPTALAMIDDASGSNATDRLTFLRRACRGPASGTAAPSRRCNRLFAVGRRIRDLYASEQPSRIQAKVGDAFLRSLVDQVTTGFGGKVAVARRLFLRELTDILDRVDQHQDFDPAVHYKLTVKEDELRPEELAAIRGDAAPADEEIDEPPPPPTCKGGRRLDG